MFCHMFCVSTAIGPPSQSSIIHHFIFNLGFACVFVFYRCRHTWFFTRPLALYPRQYIVYLCLEGGHGSGTGCVVKTSPHGADSGWLRPISRVLLIGGELIIISTSPPPPKLLLDSPFSPPPPSLAPTRRLDIFAMYALNRSFKWVSKRSIFYLPIMGWAMPGGPTHRTARRRWRCEGVKCTKGNSKQSRTHPTLNPFQFNIFRKMCGCFTALVVDCFMFQVRKNQSTA